MGKVEYQLSQLLPHVEAGYSGNPLDPAQVSINKAMGRYGAVPPFFISRREKEGVITRVEDVERIRADYEAYGIVRSVMPMYVRSSGQTEWYRLPLEPLVAVSGKNTIVRRQVAKSKLGGTVKECWTQDDYEVNIQGLATASDEEAYPEECVRKLIGLFGSKHPVEVDQPLLQLFGIRSLAVESCSFPHTKGMNNQNYEIKAYSDTSAQLLIPL